MKKTIRFIALALLTCLFLSIPVNALSSHQKIYDTYSYSYDDNSELAGTTAYLPTETLNGNDLGVGPFDNLTDIYINESTGKVFITDSGKNRIIITDSAFSNVSVLYGGTLNGQLSNFSSPNGIFIDSQNNIFVADTGNSRILKLSPLGEILLEIKKPNIKQFETMDYKPLKVTVSPQGEIYVIAEGVYEGIINFDSTGEYQGFSGSNKVSPSIWELFWYKVSSRKQKASMSSFLPVVFKNIDIGDDEFVYSVAQYDENSTSLLKKLNPGGNDVLRNNSGQNLLGDLGNIYYGRYIGRTTFTDICYLGNEITVCLDSSRSKLFFYTGDAELMFAFGSRGEQYGNLTVPTAVDNLGYNLYVTDSTSATITVYTPTDYGKSMLKGISAYTNGDFTTANQQINKALSLNSNSELAYLVMGKMNLRNKDYSNALNNFYLANNRTYYSKAFENYRNQIIGEYFYYIFAAVILFLLYLILRSIIIKKRTKKPIEEIYAEKGILGEVTFAQYCMLHPFKGFNDIKREGRGNVLSATILVILLSVGTIFNVSMKGYIFGGKTSPNLLIEIAKIILPLILFCSINWGVTTLFDGEANLKSIYISCCYALWPMIVSRIPLLLLSNVLTIEESSIFFTLETAVYIYTIFLILVGNLTTQNFTMKKAVWMSIVTLLGMAIVIFILFLVFNLWYEIASWISQMVKELQFR